MDRLDILVTTNSIAGLTHLEAKQIGPGKLVKSTVAGVTRFFEYVSGDKLAEASYFEQTIDFSQVQNAVEAAPAAADSTGVAGTFAYESGFFYVCVATDTWQRVAIATWP